MAPEGSGSVRTITLKTHISADGRLQLDVPADLPPGPVDVVLVIQPDDTAAQRDIRELRGLGRDVWRDIEAQAYVDRFRDEWER